MTKQIGQPKDIVTALADLLFYPTPSRLRLDAIRQAGSLPVLDQGIAADAKLRSA